MKHIIIGTAGHVDHGKTSLIKALTNIDCDTHKEEKERGITINLGFSHLVLASGEAVGIVDVPGHKDFIKTMLSGAFGIDIVLLVIAADSGIMPQTIEHLKIIEMLGVNKAIIVLTKTDIVDEEMVELAEMEIEEFLEGSVFENSPIVKVSSVKNIGMDELVSQISEQIKTIESRKCSAIFRMYIDRIFNVKGIGFVVTGSVLDGEIAEKEELFLLPKNGKKVKVRSLQRHGDTIDKISCGDRAALNLVGLKAEDYQRGMQLSNKEIPETAMIDASYTLFDIENETKLWSKVIFYSGTYESAARIHLLDKDKLGGGERGIVQIHLEKPSVLMNGDRFIIRNSSNNLSLGGGVIIDTSPLHHRKRTQKLIKNLTSLVESSLNSDKLLNLIKITLRKGNAPVSIDFVAKELSKTKEEIANESKNSDLITLYQTPNNHILVDQETRENFQQNILKKLEEFHLANPLSEKGLSPKEFYGKLKITKDELAKEYLTILLKEMCSNKALRKFENNYSLHTHQVVVDKKTNLQLKFIEEIFLSGGMEIIPQKRMEERTVAEKINKENLKMYLSYLTTKGKLYFYQGDYIHQEIIARSRTTLIKELQEKEKGINEKEVRILLNATKRFTQVLLGILIENQIIIKDRFYIKLYK